MINVFTEQPLNRAEALLFQLIKQHSFSWRTVVGTSPLELQRSVADSLRNYRLKGNNGKAVTINGVEYSVPYGYTLRDNDGSTATAFYCTRDSDNATGTLNLTTGVFTASTFTPGKTTKTVNAHGVPLEYQEVTYLKSNGNGEYIDTGIIPVQGDDVSVDIYDFQTFQTGGKNLLGLTYYGEWSSAKGWYVGIAGQSGKNAWNCRPTVSPDPTYNALGITTGHSYKLSINGNGYYVDDVRKITLGSLIQTIDTGKSLWLFAVNGGTPAYNSGIWAYGVTDIKVNGVLVRRFVPVKNPSDDTYGMYDLVSDTFFGNEGDGAFTGGSANQLEVPLFHYRGVGDKTANLFDYSARYQGVYQKEDGTFVNNAPDAVSAFIEVEPNTTYWISETGSRRGKFFDKNKQPIQATSFDFNSTLKGTFTTGATTKYIRFGMSYIPEAQRMLIMFVKGSTEPTDYIPYGYDNHIITTDENGNVDDYHVYAQEQEFSVGNVADEISYLGGEVIKIGHITLPSGTHTITDAKSNGEYVSNIPTSGNLDVKSITIPSGYGNVEVVYELESQITKEISVPEITISSGNNYLSYVGALQPSELMAVYKSTLSTGGITDVADLNITPLSRNEVYLKACCEECGCEELPTPVSRIEDLLYQLADLLGNTETQNNNEVSI